MLKICYSAVIVLSVVLCDCCKPMNNYCKLLAIVGWKCGCQPFSCRCSQNVTHCRKDTCGTCLFSGIHSRHSFWEFQTSTPFQKQLPEFSSTLQQLCIMVASCPSLRCSCMRNLSNRDKQRVWSRSCGVEDLLQCSDCALRSAHVRKI